MPKKPTLLQKRFAKEYVKDGNKARAVMRAGSKAKNIHTASQIGGEMLKRPEVKRQIDIELKKSGFTDDYISNYLKDIAVHSLEDAKNGKKSNFTVDHGIKAVDMVAKLRNLYPDKKTTIEKKSVNIKYESKAPDQLIKEMDKINEKVSKYKKYIEVV